MGDQLGDAENAGFNPYEHARRKREAETNAEAATAAAELAIVAQWTERVAGVLADDELGVGYWQTITREDASGFAEYVTGKYRHIAVTVLTLLAPEIARREALVHQLRAHLTAEADRLSAQQDRTMTAASVAEVLRAIVEATR